MAHHVLLTRGHNFIHKHELRHHLHKTLQHLKKYHFNKDIEKGEGFYSHEHKHSEKEKKVFKPLKFKI